MDSPPRIDRRSFFKGMIGAIAMVQPDSSPILYQVDLDAAGVDLLLTVNGVEIMRRFAFEAKTGRAIVNSWLTARDNEIALATFIPDSTVATRPLEHSRFSCQLLRGPRSDPEPPAVTGFSGSDLPQPAGTSPGLIWHASFSADPCYGPWLWERAEAITFDDSVAEAARQLVESVVIALNWHEDDTLLELFRVRTEETARSLGVSNTRFEEGLLTWSKGWRAALRSRPHRDEFALTFALTLEGRDRLLRIERNDGKPIFNQGREPSIDDGPQKIYAGRVDGRWLILR